MYLIIGDEYDSCVVAVRSALAGRGKSAVAIPNPFGEAGRLRWRFDTHASALEYTFTASPDDFAGMLEGVFVRNFAALQDSSGWTPEDAAYMHSEGMAALLAWVHALPCPVVGRPSDDVWYRPQRPIPEWVGILAACGLPTPEVIVTNTPGAERRVAAWSGRATYQPMTSPRGYVIQGPAWAELEKVMRHVPVCLVEPLDGTVDAVTKVGNRLFWTNRPVCNRNGLEEGVRRVADKLQSDFVQLNYQATTKAVKFTTVNLQPLLDIHDSFDQQDIADEIACRLLGASALVLDPAACCDAVPS